MAKLEVALGGNHWLCIYYDQLYYIVDLDICCMQHASVVMDSCMKCSHLSSHNLSHYLYFFKNLREAVRTSTYPTFKQSCLFHLKINENLQS